MASPRIPDRLIFVWIGPDLPLTAQIAIASAIDVCAPHETVLIADGLRPDAPGLAAVADLPGFRWQAVDDALLAELPGFAGDGAAALYRDLKQPAARSNLLRLAELWHRGGVYLDTDTITVRPFGELLDEPAFIGVEPIAWPTGVRGSFRPDLYAKACARVVARYACQFAPRPERAFERLRRFFPLAVNNAVMGACPHNPAIGRALETIAAMPVDQRLRRFRLGTHLMQEITQNRSGEHMRVLEPAYFYPLGPEISVAWFSPNSAQRLPSSLDARTRVVHWYASVQDRLAEPIERPFIEANRDHVAFARMAWPYVTRGRSPNASATRDALRLPAMSHADEVGFESADGRVSARRFGSVFATHFRQGLTVAAMQAYADWQREQLAPDDQIVSLSLLFAVERIPDEVREATSRYIAEFGPRTKASATVIAASGFAAAAGRAMTSTFYLVTRAGFPRKVFADLDAAEQWLAPHLDDAAELHEGAAYLRSLEPEPAETSVGDPEPEG